MQQKQIIEAAKRGIELYYRQEPEFFAETRIVIGNNILRPSRNKRQDKRQPYHIAHNQYRIVFQSGQLATVVGTFHLLADVDATHEKTHEEEKICVASVTVSCGEQRGRVTMLHISEKAPARKYELRDVRECCYLLDEMDVFYLEAGHNRTRWHCRGEVIETAGNLSHSEKRLSDSFVRIHRGFIVNKFHVHKIARCYVELDNGEQLQVPVKKYMAVKEQLRSDERERD